MGEHRVLLGEHGVLRGEVIREEHGVLMGEHESTNGISTEYQYG